MTKAKKLSSWIFENVPNENCSRLTEKRTKNRRQVFFAYDEPENHIRKGKGKSEEKERRRRKKAMNALLVFMLGSLKIAFERKKKLMGEIYFGCKVMA